MQQVCDDVNDKNRRQGYDINVEECRKEEDTNTKKKYLDDLACVVDNKDRHFNVFTRRLPTSFEITSLNHQVELVPTGQRSFKKKKTFLPSAVHLQLRNTKILGWKLSPVVFYH